MKNTPHVIQSLLRAPSSPRFRPRLFLSAATMLLLLLSAQSNALAGSATWKASPATGDWNTASNWTPATIPNGPSDTAMFATSNRTSITLSADEEVNGIVFNAGASAFMIDTGAHVLRIDGVGITNNSGITQNFVAGFEATGANGLIGFNNSATAGSGTSFTIDGTSDARAPSAIVFIANSSAGNGIFITLPSTVSAVLNNNGGEMFFDGSSTAANGTFTINGGTVSGAPGGYTAFGQTSTAANGTFTINGGTVSGAGGGIMYFGNRSGAGAATLIANGGSGGGGGCLIRFFDFSRGGTARVEVFGNSDLDISGHKAPGVTTGSIEGSGNVFLGATNLTVGRNNLSTTFSGVIRDGGQNGGTGGSLTKTGNGKLTLTKANIYTGGTTINAGTLLVKNKTGSATGSGAVQVNSHGVFGGTGKINGAVTVGNGGSSFAAALLAGTANGPGTLTINNTLTFNSPSVYECILDTTTPAAGKVTALGVTINFGSHFIFSGGSGTLTPGTVFTVIDNTSANPMGGNFSNLPDASIFTSNGNNFLVNYEGGDGNDLALTVQ